jgi:ABC-type transport system involved in multi-copper enzyme maturation permease subunit
VKLTAALIAHEWRYQRRTLRFRAFAGAYLALACLPAIIVFLRRQGVEYAIGGATYAGETLMPLPFLTAVLAGLLSLDGINRERGSGAWTTATLAGVSSSGYLVRRWLALLAVLLPLTAVPPMVAAGLAVAGGNSPLVPAVFLGPWLLHVVPLAAVVAAIALGLGTIGGSAVRTFLLSILAFGVVPAVGSEVLDHFRMRFGEPTDWMDLREARGSAMRMTASFNSKNQFWQWYFPLPLTEAGFDLGTAAEQELADGLLLASLAAASLGLAAFYFRRTRPDVRPQKIRQDHPLRTFLVTLGRVREQYTPDPAPEPVDLAVLALAGFAVLGAVALQAHRAVSYGALAADRWRVETDGGPAPTPVDVVPENWRIEGGFDGSGWVAVTVIGTLRNGGTEPQGHLAFALDPQLRLAGIATDEGHTAVHRSWDRLAVELDPAIPPGGRREIRFRLEGRPGEPEFGLPKQGGGDQISFLHSFARHRDAKFAADRTDLSRGYQVPAVSGYRIALAAPCLTPVPRYRPWTADNNGFVPAESYFPQAAVELKLAVPADLLVADSCGGLSDPLAPMAPIPGRAGRLDSRCALPLSEVAVMGGRQRLLASSGKAGAGAAVAVFPGHRNAGELHLGFLTRSAQLMDEAWPGMGGLERLVILEWPQEEVHDRQHDRLLYRWRLPGESLVRVTGNLVFLEEPDLIGSRPLAPEPMMAEIVAARLTHRRRLEPKQSRFFLELFRSLVLQRLGLGARTGAVFTADPPHWESLHRAALASEGYGYSYWTERFPALLSALSRRAGAEPLRASIEELLERPGNTPATYAEWAEILKRRSEGPVEPLLRDFFEHGYIPMPTLVDVDFQPAGGAWRVTGKVHNEGEGEAACRVVLTTDLGPVETTVTTGAGATVPFVLTTSHRPQGVYLDPDQECHRGMRQGLRDRVFFQGGHQ